MKVKSCFKIMIKIDFDKFLKILECTIRTIFLIPQNNYFLTSVIFIELFGGRTYL
jgi:hypothetical protein